MERLLFVNAEHCGRIVSEQFNEISSNPHTGPRTVTVNKLSFLIFRLFYHVVCLTVFQYFDLSVDLKMQAHFFISRSFLEIVGDYVKVVLDHIAKRSGVAQFQKDVIDRTNIDIFYSIILHMAQNTLIFHL